MEACIDLSRYSILGERIFLAPLNGLGLLRAFGFFLICRIGTKCYRASLTTSRSYCLSWKALFLVLTSYLLVWKITSVHLCMESLLFFPTLCHHPIMKAGWFLWGLTSTSNWSYQWFLRRLPYSSLRKARGREIRIWKKGVGSDKLPGGNVLDDGGVVVVGRSTTPRQTTPESICQQLCSLFRIYWNRSCCCGL